MDERDVGGMAEARLVDWSHQVGITPNKAQYDKEAWDYLLQFPYRTDVSAPTLDQREPRIECLVQVKGIDSARKRKSIPLDRWERLVRTPLPSFFLVVDYASRNQPKEAYLMHIEKSWIETLLLRLRQIESKDIEDLKSRTLDLTWGKQDQLVTLDGDGLKEAIISHIEDGMVKYCQNKINLLKNAGDPIPFLFEASADFESDEARWDTLIDFAIGVQETLPTSKLVIKRDVRFGIPTTVETMSEGLLRVKKLPAIECIINFQNDLGTLSTSIPADLYAPNWFFPGAEISRRHFRARAVFEVGEVVIKPRQQKLHASFRFWEAESSKSLVDHAGLWRIVLILNELTGFKVEIKTKDDIVIGSGRLDSPLSVNLDDGTMDIARAVDDAYFVARYFDVPVSKVVHLEQIMLQENQLKELRLICDVNHRVTAVTGSGMYYSDISEEVATPIVRRIVFDDISLLAAVVVAGRLSITDAPDDKEQDWIIEKPRRILQRHAIISNEHFDTTSIDDLVNIIVEQLDEQGIDTILINDKDRSDTDFQSSE